MLKELDVQTMEETNGGTLCLVGGLLWGILGAIFTRPTCPAPTLPTCPAPAPKPTCPVPAPTLPTCPAPAPKPTCP